MLIVDDDPAVRHIVALTLQSAGHVTFEASNGQEGLDCLDRTSIAVVVFDLQMPVMDGPAFWRAMGERGPRPRSLVLSAHRATEVGRELGVDAILDKPFDIDELSDTVRRLCDMDMVATAEAAPADASAPAGCES